MEIHSNLLFCPSCKKGMANAPCGFGHVRGLDGQAQNAYNRHTRGKAPRMALSRVEMGNQGDKNGRLHDRSKPAKGIK